MKKLNYSQKLSFLEIEFEKDVFRCLQEHIESINIYKIDKLVQTLVIYNKILIPFLNSKSRLEINSSLKIIKIHLSKKYQEENAKLAYKILMNFIHTLEDKKIIEKSDKHEEENDWDYIRQKKEAIHSEDFAKIEMPLEEKLLKSIEDKFGTNASKITKNYLLSLNKPKRTTTILSTYDFIKTTESIAAFGTTPEAVKEKLVKYNLELNKRKLNERPTPSAMYASLVEILKLFKNEGVISNEIMFPKYINRKEQLGNSKHKNKSLKSSENKIHEIKKTLNKESLEKLRENIYKFNSHKKTESALKDIIKYMEVLKEPLNNNSVVNLENLTNQIFIDIALNYPPSEAIKRIENLTEFIENYFDGDVKLNKIATTTDLVNLKNNQIDELLRAKFKKKQSSEEVFSNLLEKECSKDISSRLNDYVNSYKEEFRKSYRKPLIDFISEISKESKTWEKEPERIQAALINYRDNLLKELNRNTVYQRYQVVANAIRLLIEHNLIPQSTFIPKNLRNSTATKKQENLNPLILNVNIYNDSNVHHFLNSADFVDNIKSELSRNINELVQTAREIILNGYKKFLNVKSVISKSKNWSFVINKNSSGNYANPFNQLHEHCFENRVAYYNHYFEDMVKNERQHNYPGLIFGNDVLGLFGLTPTIVSAMHIIITEELGFNPHSIYEAEITSREKGEVYIIINDEGGVRIKLYKKRARRVREVTAKGKNYDLRKIEKKDISASECFKIAIEMGERTREVLKTDKLWTCLLVGAPAALPHFSTFQNYFKNIANLAYDNSGLKALKNSTLKKLRSSKGVLIYLETNGNILKATDYFGNTVRTALKAYIPTYLSELIYRVKIRTFQNILIYMAISKNEKPFLTLNISQESYTEQLKEAFNNSDLNGPLAKKLFENQEQREDNTVYFCLSNTNLILALKYIKEGDNKRLKDLCISVIKKISEGPSQIKEMLRKAQLYLENESKLTLGINKNEA